VNINESEVMEIALISPALAVRSGLQSILQAETGLRVYQSVARPSELAIPAENAKYVLVAGWGNRLAELVEHLPAAYSELPILVLSDGPLSRELLRLFSGRYWGALSLNASGGEIVAALRALKAGLWVASPESLGFLFEQPVNPKAIEDDAYPIERLTGRETEILQLISAGLSNKEIAARLEISGHTVKYHVSSIYSKLGVSNRTEASHLGIRLGLVTL
jgi:DNA-binding NarL/FixJ family response regulator